MAQVLSIRSQDVSSTEDTWSKFVPSAQLQRVDPKRFDFDWLSWTMSDLSLIRYRLGADVRATIRPEGQLIAAQITADDGWLRSGRSDLDRDRPWATDGREVTADWEGTATARTMIITPDAADQLARQITADEHLRVHLHALSPRSEAAARAWTTAFDYLLAASTASEGEPLIVATLHRHAILTVLSTFASTFQAALEIPSQRRAAPRSVKQAMAYIHAHAHEPITLDDIAAAAHLSTRGLQYAFRRALEATPTEYLRRVRMDGAHGDLLRAAPDDTVAGIARRWGFGHPSRFAAAYRLEYGRHPRDTLRSE